MSETENILPDSVRKQALLIAPEDDIRRTLQLLLLGCGLSVRAFGSVRAALADRSSIDAHILALTQHHVEGDGAVVLDLLREHGWRGRAILVMDAAPENLGKNGRDAGFDAVLDKPVGRLALLSALAE
jgi:CheY-like chemotaxis protein